MNMNVKLFDILQGLGFASRITRRSCFVNGNVLLIATQDIMPLKLNGFIFNTNGEKITIELEQEVELVDL